MKIRPPTSNRCTSIFRRIKVRRSHESSSLLWLTTYGPVQCSVFQSPIFAIMEAAEFIKIMEDDKTEPLPIYMDNHAAFNAFESSKTTPDMKNGPVIIRHWWVIGHCNIEGIAGELARMDSQSKEFEVADIFKSPLYRSVKTSLQIENQSELEPLCKVPKQTGIRLFIPVCIHCHL